MSDQPLALVTGAAHQLGKAFVLALARRGYAILLHYRNSELQASRTASQIRTLGMPVFLSQADLTDPKQISSLFALVDKIPHPLKVLVNSAATIPVGDPRTLSAQEWDAAFDLNFARAVSLRAGSGQANDERRVDRQCHRYRRV